MQVCFALLFLTLAFVGTSTGSEYMQWPKPQALASSTNGSTLREIMKEQNFR